MTTSEVANQLVELCRNGKIDEVLETLFAEDAQSIEANESMGPKIVTGLDGIKAKSVAFQEGVEEFHGATISDPIVAGNSFAITWALDATFKGQGRMTIEEVCVYQVNDGKVILEQFFY
ncbi:MAG: SnoaL-like domain-containing protein [Ferruginibacter sp.]